MSRHRAIRNRAYSYDDDWEDDWEEEEDEEEEHEDAHAYTHPSSRPQPNADTTTPSSSASSSSLSSYLTHAAQPVPQRPRPSQKHESAHGLASSPDGRPHLTTIDEAFDADLVDPAFWLLKSSGQVNAVEFTDERIRYGGWVDGWVDGWMGGLVDGGLTVIWRILLIKGSEQVNAAEFTDDRIR